MTKKNNGELWAWAVFEEFLREKESPPMYNVLRLFLVAARPSPPGYPAHVEGPWNEACHLVKPFEGILDKYPEAALKGAVQQIRTAFSDVVWRNADSSVIREWNLIRLLAEEAEQRLA